MAKYILHGGNTKNPSESNKKFFKEITRNLKEPVKILIMLFSRDKALWKEIYLAIQKFFTSTSPKKEINFSLATNNIPKLINQIKESDVIYMHGGNTYNLKAVLEKIPNLENLWKNKIVSGLSAGALVLGKYFYENDDETCDQGLGILPYKILVHYNDKKQTIINKLKNYKESLKILTIPEEKFLIINF